MTSKNLFKNFVMFLCLLIQNKKGKLKKLKLRKLYKLPIKINSGFRCKDHPLTISRPESKGISSHAKGLAADISAKSSRERYALVQLLYAAN